MRPTHHRIPLTIALAGVLALTVAGCANGNADEPNTTTTSSSSSSTPSGNWDEDHAKQQAEKAVERLNKHNVNKPLDENQDAEWASPQYVQAYNKELKDLHDKQVTKKGNTNSTSVHLKNLDPQATGGPDLTIINCSVSTVRLIGPDGKDVTGDIETGEPLPKKPVKAAHLMSLTTTDKGETWQISGSQILRGESAKETPCELS